MRTILIGLAGALALFACGGDTEDTTAKPVGDAYTSDPNTTVVVGPGAGTGTVVATPSGDACVTLPSGECVKPQDKCGDQRADVVVDSTGKVVAIVCYPAAAEPTPIDGAGNIDIGKDNKAVVAIDGADDGVDVAGDVASTGNNVVVYGKGAGVSVIGGNVGAEGNNFSMRGVTVKGNVEVTGNNATMVLCVIEGDLVIRGNNTVLADCTVGGKIEVVGNNTVLVGNRVGGTIVLSDAKNTVCDGNTSWSDANSNKLLDPGEAGAALACIEPKDGKN